MALTIDELFTPATNTDWLSEELQIASEIGLTTSAWQSGGMVRTIMAIMSNIYAQQDGIVSLVIQGGFLDFAATGTVTYTAANGQTVTAAVSPDPSDPASGNTNGAATWLDLLADSSYDVQRTGAAYATNPEVIVNTTGSTLGPYTAGSYHVANPSTQASYSNTGDLTIPPSSILGTAITAASNTNPILITTSSNHGQSTGAVVYITGVVGNTAANGFWIITRTSNTQFTLNGSLGNGGYVSGGIVYSTLQAEFSADVQGPTGSSAVGQITQAVTSNLGVYVTNVEAFFGAPYESNVALATRCRLRLQSLSPGGPAGAYAYFALSAYQILSLLDPPVVLSSPITRALVQSYATTGTVVTTIANSTGAVDGVSNLLVTGATNASPIEITTYSPHHLVTGNSVEISGVIGNTNANGQWIITQTGSSKFTLNGSSGNAAYVSGGVVEGGDLGEVDYVIQSNAVPDNTVAITQSATNFNVAIVATVLVPQAYINSYLANAQAALAVYFQTLPIGGINSGQIQYNDIIGILYAAGVVNNQPSYVLSIPSLTLNSGTINLSYPLPTSVAVLSPTPNIVVSGG